MDGEVELLQKSDDIGGGNREPGSWEAGKLDCLEGKKGIDRTTTKNQGDTGRSKAPSKKNGKTPPRWLKMANRQIGRSRADRWHLRHDFFFGFLVLSGSLQEPALPLTLADERFYTPDIPFVYLSEKLSIEPGTIGLFVYRIPRFESGLYKFHTPTKYGVPTWTTS